MEKKRERNANYTKIKLIIFFFVIHSFIASSYSVCVFQQSTERKKMQKINSTIQPKTEILSLSSTITGKNNWRQRSDPFSYTTYYSKKKNNQNSKTGKKNLRGRLDHINLMLSLSLLLLFLCDPMWLNTIPVSFFLLCFVFEWLNDYMGRDGMKDRLDRMDWFNVIFLSFSFHSCMSLYVIKNDDE